MITGERCIGQRSSFSRIECSQRNQEARRWNKQVGSHAAVVTAKPAAAGGAASVLAIILHAHAAVLAVSAAPGAVHNHGVTGREPGGAGPKLLDPAGVLMAEGEGEPDRPLRRGPLHQVE